MDFWKFEISIASPVRTANMRHYAKCCAYRSKRCRDTAIFGFFKMLEILSAGPVQRAIICNRAKFRADWSSRCQDIAIFKFLRLAAAAILNFWNFKFLTVGCVNSVEQRHYGKFRVDRSNYCRYITIFRLIQDVCRPPSWICDVCVGTTHEWHLMVLITVQNLVLIDTVVSIICTFFDFASLAWKRLFTP